MFSFFDIKRGEKLANMIIYAILLKYLFHNLSYMTIQKIKKLSSKTNAFTLVELIIVITILAILATIAFISFKNYAGNARDGNKLTTLSNIEK